MSERTYADGMRDAAAICESRRESLHRSGRIGAALEAGKCATAIQAQTPAGQPATPAPDAVTLPEGVEVALKRIGKRYDMTLSPDEERARYEAVIRAALKKEREAREAAERAANENKRHYEVAFSHVQNERRRADSAEARVRELEEALEGLMQFESRGRLVPVGEEWNKARAALSQTCVIHQWGAFVIRHETPCIACGITYGEHRAARDTAREASEVDA